MNFHPRKILFLGLSIVSILGYGFFVFAAAPSGGYNPGSTLDPDCAPNAPDCIVALPGGGAVTADNGLTATSGNVQLGGTLTQQTIIDATNYLFGVGMDINGPQQTAFIVQQPAPGVYTTGIETMYADDINSPTVATRSNFGTVSLAGGTASFIGWENLISGDSFNSNISDNGIAMYYKKGTSSGPADVAGLFIDPTAVKSISNSSYSNYNTMWSNWNGSGYDSLATLSANGDWQWYPYPSTRDDSLTISPINFLYTDSYGNILSAPTSLLGGGSGWGLTGNNGTTSGTNFIGTTDAQDFVMKTNGNAIAWFGQNGNVSFGGYADNFFGGGPDWNGNIKPVSSGNGSTAWGGSLGGYNFPVASGYLSTAWGVGTNASSSFATAWGDRTNAIEENATAFGTNTTASGTDSTAWGEGSTASGGTSTAFGQTSTASGAASTSSGINTFARSAGETAMGTFNVDYIPLGLNYEFKLEDRLLSIGNGQGFSGTIPDWSEYHNAYTLWKDGSFAYNDDNFQNDDPGTEQNMFYFNYGNHDGLGNVNTKRAIRLGSALNDEWDINSANVGDRSIAIGFSIPGFFLPGPVASGDASMAFGYGAQATGDGSIAFNNGIASANGAFAFNSGIASGIAATAFNSGGASGLNAVAWGGGAGSSANDASGQNAVVAGYGMFAPSFNEVAFGNFGTEYTPVSINNVFASADRLFVISNGTSPDPGYRSDAFTILKNGQTGVGIDNFETNTNGNIFQVGDSSTNIIGYVNNGTGAWVAVSDERKKDNITDLTYGLDTILQLNPKSYTMKVNGEHSIGFIAQDVKDIVPESVFGSETKGYGMSYATLTPVIVKAIQEMNLNIANISDMTQTNTWREALIAWFGNMENGITDLYAKIIHTDRVETKELCVGSVCVTEDQFLQVMNQSGQSEIIIQIDQPVVDDSTPVINDNPENTDDGSVETTETDQPANMDPVPENNISTEEIPVQ